MNLVKQLNERRNATRSEEEGFTLIELMIVVVIIGILAAVAIPIFANQQRASIESTVKEDVVSNRAVMVPGANSKLYTTSDKFMDISVSTADNQRGYSVNAKGDIACTWAFHKFSATDTVAFHFLSSTGRLAEGTCPDLGAGSDTVTSDGSAATPNTGPEVIVGEPATGTPSATPTATPSAPTTATPSASLLEIPAPTAGSSDYTCAIGSVNYQNNWNKGSGMNTFTLSVTKKNSSAADWNCTIDYSAAPFFGAKPVTYDGQVVTADAGGTKVKYSNTNSASGLGSNNSLSFNFSTYNITYLNSPSDYTATVAIDPSDSKCALVKVTSTSKVPTAWSTTVDIAALFPNKATSSTQAQGSISMSHISGTKYLVSGESNLFSLNSERPIVNGGDMYAKICNYS